MADVDTVALAVAKIINTDVPGASAHAVVSAKQLFYGGDRASVVFRYQCPCGETSNIAYVIPKDVASIDGAERFIADELKRAMRQHVRSEGNEPNF